MFEKNNTIKTQGLNKKLLTTDEIAFNVRENLRYLIDTKKISFKNLISDTGSNEMAIKNILNGSYVNIDSYLVYRIAHYFGYELDVFIQSNANQLAMLKPTVSAFKKPIDAKQFQENYLNKISSLIEQKNISKTEINHYSSFKKDRPKLTIYELHQAEYILDTNITHLFASPLSKTSNSKTLKKLHLEEICDKVLTLIKQHNINMHQLALAISEPPLATINFFAGVTNSPTNHTKLLFKIANHLNVDFNALLRGNDIEFISASNISDNLNNLEKVSKNLSISEIDIVENYRCNLSFFTEIQGIKKSQLAKILEHPINLIESGTNPIVVQDVANFFGYDPHTWLSYKSHQLPKPNPGLIEKILKKTAKVLAIGGVLGVTSVAPAVAFDYAVDEAYQLLSNYKNDAIIPDLASDHPLNLHIKLGILTALIALEHVIVAEKLVEKTITATIQDGIKNVTENKSLVEKILSPPIDLINIFNDVAEDYLENVDPIKRDSKAWFETFNMLMLQSAKMFFDRFASLKLEAKEEFDEALIKAQKESSTFMSHYRNMEDAKNYVSRTFGSEKADHNLEKSDAVTSDYDNSEIDEILENIMNNHPSGIHYGEPKKSPDGLKKIEKIRHFAKKVISDKSDDYLEKIICSGVSTTSYYLTQGVLNYAIAITTLEFAFFAILFAQPGIDKAAEIIGDFAEKKCHDTIASLKDDTRSSSNSSQVNKIEKIPKLNTDSFTNEVHLTSARQDKNFFKEEIDFQSLTKSTQPFSNAVTLQNHKPEEISKAISKANQIDLNKNYQPEFKFSQANVGFFHKMNSSNETPKISAATASNNSNTPKWHEISIITRPLPPPPGIPDSNSLITTPTQASFQVDIMSGNYECLRVNDQSSISFFDNGVLKTATAPSGYSIHGLYCRPEGSSDNFKLMKSGPK